MYRILYPLAIVAMTSLVCYAMLSCESVKGEEKVYPDRWVYVSRGLGQDEDVSEIREIVRTSSEHGLNGMVLAAGLDSLSRRSPDHLRDYRRSNNSARNIRWRSSP